MPAPKIPLPISIRGKLLVTPPIAKIKFPTKLTIKNSIIENRNPNQSIITPPKIGRIVFGKLYTEYKLENYVLLSLSSETIYFVIAIGA